MRRWYVLLGTFAVTLAVAFVSSGPTTVYFTRTTVNILQPDRGKVRIVGFNSPDQIAVANVLTARLNGGVHTPLASDPDVTLPSIGILEGTHAQVRNIGGQWLSQVTEPVVDIQAVAPDEAQAKQMLATKVKEVGTQLTILEDELKVPTNQRIELEQNPAQPDVEQITTPRSRALVGYGLAGLAFSLCVTRFVDAVLTRRQQRRSA